MTSIKINYIYNLCYQLLVLVTPLLTIPYVSRILGADGVGTVSYIDSVSSFFTLFAILGTHTYGQREISYVQDSREKRTEVFWNVTILRIILSIVVTLIYLIFIRNKDNYSLYLIFAFSILAVSVDVTWFFQGIEEFGKIFFRNLVFKIINIAGIFLLVKSREDIVIYAAGFTLFTLICNLLLWIHLPKYIDKPKQSKIKPFKNINIILSLFIPTIAIQIYTVLDKVMIGTITENLFESGYYEQALKVLKMVLAVITALSTVMIPRIGFYYKKKMNRELEQLMYQGYRFVFFLGIPLCFGLIVISDFFVPWFFGAGYEKVSVLLKILAVLIPVMGISNVTGMQYLIPTNRHNLYTFTVVVGACINFGLNLFLIQRFLSIGAAIASVVAEMIIMVLQLAMIRKELSIIKILKDSLHYFCAGAGMAILLYFLKNILQATILHTMIVVSIGAAAYFLILLLIRDDFFIYYVNKFLKKIVKK